MTPTEVISICGIVLSASVGVLAIVNIRTQNAIKASVDALHRSEDQRRADVAALEARNDQQMAAASAKLHDMTVKLLDERDRRISHSISGVANQISLYKEHAAASDKRFEQLATALPKIEIELVKTLSDAREFVRSSAASRVDFDKFCDQSSRERREINLAITELERKVVTTEDLKQVLREIREDRT